MNKNKPVTELRKLAWIAWSMVPSYHPCHAELRDAMNGMDAQTVEVLDLVATSNRLGLVRWVVGLSASDCALLRWALADGTCNTMVRVLPEDSQRLRAMFASLHAALSGGEGGDKCKACEGDGYHSREVLMEHGITEIGKKCGECDGTGEAKKVPKPTILPAGKPPPFLRVGMVWRTGVGHDRVRLIELSPTCGGKVVYVDTQHKWTSWVAVEVLLTWPLAEPFTVEGEELARLTNVPVKPAPGRERT